MRNVELLLIFIAVLLFLCWWELAKLNSRLKTRFPTAAEEDYKLSQEDPLTHWEIHKHDQK